MTMAHQLPQIALLRAGHRQPRETLRQQQVEQQFGVAPVGLLLARGRRPDLTRMAHPQLDAALVQQSLEPARAAGGLHAHAHRLTLQAAVKRFGLAAVLQPALAALAGSAVTKCDLLKARMIITTYNQHRVDSFLPSFWSFRSNQCTRCEGADVVMKSARMCWANGEIDPTPHRVCVRTAFCLRQWNEVPRNPPRNRGPRRAPVLRSLGWWRGDSA